MRFQSYSFLLSYRKRTQVLGRQLLRSGTSVGAHYREASRDKSNPDFISKIKGALQELEESEYWLELLADSGFIASKRMSCDQARDGRAQFILHPLSFIL